MRYGEDANDHYVNGISTAIKFAKCRLDWYESGGDFRHLQEALDWIEVANIYKKGINLDAKNINSSCYQ